MYARLSVTVLLLTLLAMPASAGDTVVRCYPLADPNPTHCIIYRPIEEIDAIPLTSDYDGIPVGVIGTVYLLSSTVAIGFGTSDPCEIYDNLNIACAEYTGTGAFEQPVSVATPWQENSAIACLGVGTFYLREEANPEQPQIIGAGLWIESIGGGACRDGVPGEPDP